MQSHPLADVFPPLDERAVQELAASIVEGGLREPIVIFEDRILDGRARFRACERTGIAPRTVAFAGDDPARFVIAKNVHRHRPLNESQRGLIAARIATLMAGRPNAGIPAISQIDAAKLLGVSRDTVTAARAVLTWGSPGIIAQIESGKARVGVIARALRRTHGRTTRTKQDQNAKGKNPERLMRQRMNAELWGRVRETLMHLTSLPLASDVARVVRTNDKAGLVDARLARARRWLEEFSHAWSQGCHGQEREQAGEDHSDAGAGVGTPGVQHDQPPPE